MRSSVAKERLNSHSLMIEKGRHNNTKIQDRLCKKCDRQEIEDEYHAVMRCPYFSNQQNELFTKLSKEVHGLLCMTKKNSIL